MKKFRDKWMKIKAKKMLNWRWFNSIFYSDCKIWWKSSVKNPISIKGGEGEWDNGKSLSRMKNS